MRPSLEVDLERTRATISSCLNRQMEAMGTAQEFSSTKRSAERSNDIATLMEHGSTSPGFDSLFSTGPVPIYAGIIGVALLAIALLWWRKPVPILVAMLAIGYVVAFLAVRRKADRLHSLAHSLEQAARSQLLVSDPTFCELVEREKTLEDLIRQHRDAEYAARRERYDPAATFSPPFRHPPPSSELFQPCARCDGTGRLAQGLGDHLKQVGGMMSAPPCPICHGTGRLAQGLGDHLKQVGGMMSAPPCPICHGTGSLMVAPGSPGCARCGGTGKVKVSDTEHSLADMVKGALTLSAAREITCPSCGGSGFSHSEAR